MLIRRPFPLFAAAALPLVLFGTAPSQAGSFFGPCCYGASYAQEYPNRGHIIFGSASGCQCPARHPFFKRIRCKCGANPGATPCGAPIVEGPVQGLPAGALPAPVAQTSLPPAPAQEVSPPAESLPSIPTPAARTAPSPAPLPAGPANPEPPLVNSATKSPF
jgi:hypothetical protein